MQFDLQAAQWPLQRATEAPSGGPELRRAISGSQQSDQGITATVTTGKPAGGSGPAGTRKPDLFDSLVGQEKSMQSACVVIDSPVHGQWAIMNPPGHAVFAFDFLATRDRKLPYRIRDLFLHIFASLPVTATYAWSMPVFAPLDGVVVACCDGIPDRLRINMPRDLCALLLSPPKAGSPFSAYGGNYVVLKCGDVYPLFAHFRSGSLRVKPGDSVRKGQQLAEVGNSGMSLQPHLHFQIMNSPDPFPLFKNLLPFKIRVGKKQVREEWQEFSNVLPGNGDHFRL